MNFYVNAHPIGRVVFLLAFVSACSSVDYGEPVNDFAEATRNAETALTALDRQAAEAESTRLRALATDSMGFVRFADDECLTTSERCRLAIVVDGAEQPLTPDSLIGNTVTLMAAIRDYADGLEKIAGSESPAQVAAHVAATGQKVKKLAGIVVTVRGSGSAVADAATPAGNLAAWVVERTVAAMKARALARATAAADPVVKEAAALFGDAAFLANEAGRARLAEVLSTDLDRFRATKSTESLDDLIGAAAAYDAVLRAKPQDVFQRLAEAHGALTAALNDDGLTLENAVARIQVFADEAKSLARILKDLPVLKDLAP